VTGAKGDDSATDRSESDVAKVASPEATGSAGGTYESRAAAIALCRLLRGDRIAGLGLPIARVRLQQRFAGLLLDDIVVEGTDPSGSTRVVEFQAKRQISPAKSDVEFVETVGRCLESVNSDTGGHIAAGRHRFGIIAKPSTALHDLARVTEVARAHDQPSSFVCVLRTTARNGVVQRLNQLRETVVACLTAGADTLVPEPPEMQVDELTWKVAKSLHIWELNAEAFGDAVLAAQDRIADLAITSTDEADIVQKLEQLARNWAPSAASIDLAMLRRALEDDGVALNSAPAQAAAFLTLASASAPALDLRAAQLGGELRLPRLQLRADVVDSVREHGATLLSGRAGVGKSMLGRLVAEDLRADGATVVALNLTGRAGSLSVLEADLGVRLRDGFAGAPIGAVRVLIIDGAEQALSDTGALLKAVLDTLAPAASGAPPWRALVTARDEAATTVLALIGDRITDATRLSVGELSDPEVAQVLERFPVLQPLRRNPRAEALLLRRPYLIELLLRSTIVTDLPPMLVGEEDLLDVVTARLVRRDDGALPGGGQADARSDIYLALAVAAIGDALPSSLDGRDGAARAGLRSDDVIVPVRLSWRFAHDVLVDYAVATRLLEPVGDALLLAAPQPRRLLRGVRLWMQRELADAVADDSVTAAWVTISNDARQLAAADGERWLDLPYEALFHLGLSRDALAGLADTMLADQGASLARLIDVAERLGRLNVTNDGPGPVPVDATLTGPVVDLLASLGLRVPGPSVFRAARLVHHHLAAAFAYGAAPNAGLDRASDLPSVLVGWAGDASYGDTLKVCLASLGFLAPHLQPEHESFLIRHTQDRPHNVAELIESPGSAGALAAGRPDLMLRLAALATPGCAQQAGCVWPPPGTRACWGTGSGTCACAPPPTP